MIENPYYSQDTHGPYELFPLGDFVLEEGYTLRDCKLAYATFGELNEAKDNAILVTTWYSGRHKIWSDLYIGPQHALNPEKYFIVVINQIGGSVCRLHRTPDHATLGSTLHSVISGARAHD